MKDKYTYLNYIDDLVAIINKKDEILFANDKFIDFVNISLGELESKNFFELTKEKNLDDYATISKHINSNETIIIIKHMSHLQIQIQPSSWFFIIAISNF